jgi:eukaryotic-like serine/threonine-protein kinase
MVASPSNAQSAAVPAPHPPSTLRTMLDARRASGTLLSLGEAAAVIVPLCLDVAKRHAAGEELLVHPSSVEPQSNGLARFLPASAGHPLVSDNPRDRACLPPELCKTLTPGGSRSSVFSIGAILYECVTGASVGPAMVRPRDVNPKLPEALEVLLAKALVGDPAHRPDDLGALASALHNLSPKHSIHPPDVDDAKDFGEDFDVDIRLSMLPPPQSVPSPESLRPAPLPRESRPTPSGPPSGPVLAPPRSSAANLVERLASLKRRLESDTRPRYVVNKDRMDHGPFSAVELLQQIATNGFVAEDLLRDEISGQTRPIGEWEEFAPFSEQAALKREVIAEKKVVEQVAKAEKKAGFAKSTLGLLVVIGLAAAATAWFVKSRGSRNDEVQVETDSLLDVALDGGIKGQKRANKAGGRGGPGGGGFPSGLSYEAALASNVQQIDMNGHPSGPDLTDQQLSGPLHNAAFLDSCGAPQSMHVTVRTAVKMGRAVGVTVSTSPPNGGVAACIDRAVRNIAWPVNAKMDSFTTNY